MIYCIMGLTNSGKSTLIKELSNYPESHAVMVGKIMRERHPPEFFKGRAELPETEPEVMEILHNGILEGYRKRAQHIFVDGQPRNLSQLDYFRCTWAPDMVTYITLWAPRKEREARAAKRDKDPAALALSLARMDSELQNFIDVHMAIEAFGTTVKVFDTSKQMPTIEDI